MTELEEKYLVQEQPISQFQGIRQPHHVHIPTENMYLQLASTNQASQSKVYIRNLHHVHHLVYIIWMIRLCNYFNKKIFSNDSKILFILWNNTCYFVQYSW